MYPKDTIQQVVDFIFSNDPVSEFCFLGIILLFVIFNFQLFLVRPLRYDLKKFGRDVYRTAIKGYLAVAWIGWVIIMIGFALIQAEALELPIVEDLPLELGVTIGILIIVLGVLINFRNYMALFIRSLREKLH